MVLSAAKYVRSKGETKPRSCPMIGSDIIYHGSLCEYESSTGYVGPITAGDDAFAGIAMETVDNSSGSGGDLDVMLWQEGLFLLTGSTITQAWCGQDIYASADDVVALTGDVFVGVAKQYYSTTLIWVEIAVRDFK